MNAWHYRPAFTETKGRDGQESMIRGSPEVRGHRLVPGWQRIPVCCRGPALPRGWSLALILAEPVLRAHPEGHVLTSGVRVVRHVTVATRGAQVNTSPSLPGTV